MIDRSNNLWWASARQRTPTPSVTGDLRCDIAIVGAGIMGTTTTQALAAAGIDVILVEAGEVGAGASSTPGGFVVPHFSVGSPAAVIERIGEIGERLVAQTGSSADRLFNKVRALGLNCDAKQGGWYQPAHSARAFANVQKLVAQWQGFGCNVELLSAEETAARTGVQGYHGSWYAPSGGTIHPLMYCRGLADAAVAAGARLYEHSPVLAIDQENGRQLLRLTNGTISAERVIVCTNGLSQALVPDLTASLIPLDVWQCATDPIPAEERPHLFQNGEALSDTMEHLFTYRFDRDWRLITGALDTFGVSPARQASRMAARLQKMLALPFTPRISHIWKGTGAVSAPRFPATLFERGGLIAATACNARGIALSTMVGDSLAAYVQTGEKPPVPLLQSGTNNGAGIQRRLKRIYPLMAPVLDWIDCRRSPS